MKAKSTSLLDIEKIVSASEDSKMSSNFMAENAQPLERLSNKQGVSKAQATLFAIIASSSYNDDCSLSDIKRHLGCENLDMLRLSPDLKALQQARLIRVSGRKGMFNDKDQSNFLKGLPLHHSQRIVEETDDYTIFSWQLKPSYDFIQQLLTMNAHIEVLEPISLREKMKKLLEEMLAKY